MCPSSACFSARSKQAHPGQRPRGCVLGENGKKYDRKAGSFFSLPPRAGIPGFAHGPAEKKAKFFSALTREKRKKNTQKHKNTPKKHQKQQKTPKKHQFLFFSRLRAKNKSQRQQKKSIPMAPPGPSNRENSRSASAASRR